MASPMPPSPIPKQNELFKGCSYVSLAITSSYSILMVDHDTFILSELLTSPDMLTLFVLLVLSLGLAPAKSKY